MRLWVPLNDIPENGHIDRLLIWTQSKLEPYIEGTPRYLASNLEVFLISATLEHEYLAAKTLIHLINQLCLHLLHAIECLVIAFGHLQHLDWVLAHHVVHLERGQNTELGPPNRMSHYLLISVGVNSFYLFFFVFLCVRACTALIITTNTAIILHCRLLPIASQCVGFASIGIWFTAFKLPSIPLLLHQCVLYLVSMRVLFAWILLDS